MTIYQYPSACGELIEGQIDGINFLSSYTINCYSQVILQPGQVTKTFEAKQAKLCSAIDYLAQAALISKNWRSDFTLKSDSQIPIGKGMGSSTADILAGLAAVSDYYRLNLSAAEMTDYCLKVEATDHSAYPQATIMNHVTGEVFAQFPYTFGLSVLVLEPSETVDTRESMHEISLHQSKVKEKEYKRLFKELVEAYEKEDLAWLADIAWTSALLNEQILEKPLLHPLEQLTKKAGVLGLNIAHTGSIIALWFDETKIRAKALKKYVREIDKNHYYKQLSVYHTVPGGIRREEGIQK